MPYKRCFFQKVREKKGERNDEANECETILWDDDNHNATTHYETDDLGEGSQ